MTGLEFITYFQLFLLKEVYGSLVYEANSYRKLYKQLCKNLDIARIIYKILLKIFDI